MTPAIPVIDVAAAEAGDRAELEAVRTATEEFGAIQVVNHGVPQDLVADLNARAGRLLGLPRAEKAKLASPHPYRGWRQWPDDFGRLELERFNVAQFDDIEAARAAGVAQEHLGLFAHANLWPADDPGLRDAALAYIEASRGLAGDAATERRAVGEEDGVEAATLRDARDVLKILHVLERAPRGLADAPGGGVSAEAEDVHADAHLIGALIGAHGRKEK